MTPSKLAAGNWKMNGTVAALAEVDIWQYIIKGGVIILAVAIDKFRTAYECPISLWACGICVTPFWLPSTVVFAQPPKASIIRSSR